MSERTIDLFNVPPEREIDIRVHTRDVAEAQFVFGNLLASPKPSDDINAYQATAECIVRATTLQAYGDVRTAQAVYNSVAPDLFEMFSAEDISLRMTQSRIGELTNRQVDYLPHIVRCGLAIARLEPVFENFVTQAAHSSELVEDTYLHEYIFSRPEVFSPQTTSAIVHMPTHNRTPRQLGIVHVTAYFCGKTGPTHSQEFDARFTNSRGGVYHQLTVQAGSSTYRRKKTKGLPYKVQGSANVLDTPDRMRDNLTTIMS